MQEGVVVKSTGSWYAVHIKGEVVLCRIGGKFRLGKLKLTNPVAVGDQVMVEMENNEEGTGVIRKILNRDNYVLRQSPRRKHYMHLMAANIDQAALMVTLRDPAIKPGFIDRYLLMTEPHNIPVLIVFNKIDIYTDEDFQKLSEFEEIYQRIGYDTLRVSARTGIHIDELRGKLEGQRTLVSGQSGVGKSSLLNTLDPNLQILEGKLSEYSGKGQHTTTFAEMYTLSDQTEIIDTPGIKTLSFNNLEVQDVAHNFREFFEYSKECRFGDCTHRNEPGCAVKDAVRAGAISEVRYLNYIAILSEIEDQNYWERHTDL
ncbi:ribosome small subunit-dependent GTPase A [Membranicola marinus]|uniref:Small ribosomal subunit biogenesis GTPase RsgA n=1 Tax=Membranihabitans marinus TaxID=1227546 RepID=A0A953HT10_9BACT|nr:ribosome small subunit-dependent GTPase A [Membranihabitans marinus]MBY5957805.1 ribosome small subunit-dependent GTPase A [Membranihabitans marinus]